MKLKNRAASTGHATGALMPRGLHEILEDGRRRAKVRRWSRSQRVERAKAGLTSPEQHGHLDGRGRCIPRRSVDAHCRPAPIHDLNEAWRQFMERRFGKPLGMAT